MSNSLHRWSIIVGPLSAILESSFSLSASFWQGFCAGGSGAGFEVETETGFEVETETGFEVETETGFTASVGFNAEVGTAVGFGVFF